MKALSPVVPDAHTRAVEPDSARPVDKNSVGSPSWTCSTCAVVARFDPVPDPLPDLPSGWARDGDALTCLACRRERVETAAKASGADALGVRRALAHFELLRDPTATAREIVSRLKPRPPSRTVVEEVRAELRAAGAIPGGRARRGTYPERYPELAAELRRDARRSNGEIVGGASNSASAWIVRHVRAALEADGEIEVWRVKNGARRAL